ncbi:tetratricopeptide repeat (TPR)-like superfamily protein [Wolffia australiana]
MAGATSHCQACSCGLPQRLISSRRQPLLPLQRSQSARVYPRSTMVTGAVPQSSFFHAISSLAESGSMEEALNLFETVTKPETFLWNAMIRGYALCGRYTDAMNLYGTMQRLNVQADKFTYTFVIKSCSASEGLMFHGRLIKLGLQADVYISNSLIAMYSELEKIDCAEKLFDEMPLRDLVSWNSMIDGYLTCHELGKALSCFQTLCQRSSSLKPDRISILLALQACSKKSLWKQGAEIHCYALRHGFGSDCRVCTSLMDLYCKSGSMNSAEILFKSKFPKTVVTWNVLIDGYTSNDQPHDALSCVVRMQIEDKMKPDAVTMVSLLVACSLHGILVNGKSIHGAALRRWFLPHLVLETSLVDMYGRCRDLKSAKKVFTSMGEKNLVSWNAMINSYVHNEKIQEVIELFRDLMKTGLKPDSYTLSSIVSAFSSLGLLWQAKQIHAYTMKSGYSLNALISLYAKCGDLRTSQLIFEEMKDKDIVSWNSIIMACAIHGDGASAIQLFSRMQRKGQIPNGSTFVSLLSACSISGLTRDGWNFFNVMQEQFLLVPQVEHYGCMVDLIGRSGDLDHVLSFIEKMPLAPTGRIWGSVLSAARENKRVDVAEAAAEKIFLLNHDNTGCYVILHSLYLDLGKFDRAAEIRSLMEKQGLARTMPRSVVELGSKAYSFINGDRSNFMARLTHEVSDLLSKKIEEGEGGEVAVTSMASFSLKEALQRKKTSPCQHSVRLAVCFSLISSPPGTTVLVKKNVRICSDCHVALQRMSKVCQRHIIVGDSRIYHHFKEGSCSCGGY